MKEIPMAQRTRNITRKEQCRFCDDTGFVVVQTRPEEWIQHVTARGRSVKVRRSWEIEEHGPCPFCERGYAEEHGHDGKPDHAKPPWHRTGFWQGRDTADLRPSPRSSPLPLVENHRRMGLLFQRMAAVEAGAAEDAWPDPLALVDGGTESLDSSVRLNHEEGTP